MKLLQEFLVINEQNERKIDGWLPSLDDVDAERGTVTRTFFKGSRFEPADYSEPYDVYLRIKTLAVILERTGEEGYSVSYIFDPKTNYIDDNGNLLTEKFVASLQSLPPRIYNYEDDEVNDAKVTAEVKSVMIKYARQLHLLEDIYDKATVKDHDSNDYYPDERDGDDDTGDHPYF